MCGLAFGGSDTHSSTRIRCAAGCFEHRVALQQRTHHIQVTRSCSHVERRDAAVPLGLGLDQRLHELGLRALELRLGGRAPGEPVSVVMTLHESLEVDVVNTLDAMASLDTVVEAPRMIRMETFA